MGFFNGIGISPDSMSLRSVLSKFLVFKDCFSFLSLFKFLTIFKAFLDTLDSTKWNKSKAKKANKSLLIWLYEIIIFKDNKYKKK